MAGGSATKTKIATVERRAFALELRKGGMSYRDIAAAMQSEHGEKSYSYKTAERDVKASLQALVDSSLSNVKELLALELARLDDMQAAVWNDALSGKLEAMDRALRVMAHRAELLGLPSVGLRVMLESLNGKTRVVDATFRFIEVVADDDEK